MDLNRPTLRHIIIKMTRLEDKERILKATREKQVVTHKGAPIKLSSDFSTEMFQTRRGWYEIFKVMKSKDLQPRLLYPVRLPFKIEGEMRSFPYKTKLKEFANTKVISTATNVKELVLRRRRRKEREEKKIQSKSELKIILSKHLMLSDM